MVPLKLRITASLYALNAGIRNGLIPSSVRLLSDLHTVLLTACTVRSLSENAAVLLLLFQAVINIAFIITNSIINVKQIMTALSNARRTKKAAQAVLIVISDFFHLEERAQQRRQDFRTLQ